MASREHGEEDEDDEVEEELSSSRKLFTPRTHSRDSKLMSIVAKLKKVKPVYWVLGLGGAALAVDYLVEGERSIAMSLYRGVFGGHGGHGGQGSHGGIRHTVPAARSVSPVATMPSVLQMPTYYPAYPASYYAWNGYPFGARYSHFGHGFGGHADHHGAWREHGHRGVR